MPIIITPENGAAREKVLNNAKAINDCYEEQDGVCIYPDCKQSIHFVLNAISGFTGKQKFIGICEKHYSEQVLKDHPTKKGILGIENP